MSRPCAGPLAHHRQLMGFGDHVGDHVTESSRHMQPMQPTWTADTMHQKAHQDVISLQCIDLEEFFMENANSIAGADNKLSSGFEGGVKQYAVSLEQREHVGEAVEMEGEVVHLQQQQTLHEPPQPQNLGHTRSVSMSESSSGDDSPTSATKTSSSPRRASHEMMGTQNNTVATSSTPATTTAVELQSHTLLSHPTISGQSLLLVPIANENHVHMEQQHMNAGSPPSSMVDDGQQPMRKAARRSKRESVPEENKDEKYWTRRAKNNLAAKRSRDLRREKEQAVMQRVSLLENENKALREQIRSMGDENEALKERLARYENF